MSSSSVLKRLSIFGMLAGAGFAMLAAASCRHQQLGLREQADRVRPEAYFPAITAENLNEEEVTLPTDLAGQPALILVAFKQKQQALVNTWLDEIETIERAIPDVRIIETPVISSVRWGWMANYIDRGMRSGIEKEQARGRTITLYTDVSAFREALGLESTDEIYALLLDEGGLVEQIVSGEFSNDKLDRLEDAIQ